MGRILDNATSLIYKLETLFTLTVLVHTAMQSGICFEGMCQFKKKQKNICTALTSLTKAYIAYDHVKDISEKRQGKKKYNTYGRMRFQMAVP